MSSISSSPVVVYPAVNSAAKRSLGNQPVFSGDRSYLEEPKTFKSTSIKLESAMIVFNTALIATWASLLGVSLGVGAPIFVPLIGLSGAWIAKSATQISRKKAARKKEKLQRILLKG